MLANQTDLNDLSSDYLISYDKSYYSEMFS